MKITKQIICSGIYGLAIGDVLGVPYEFSKREDIALSPCVDMVGYLVYDKPAGTFSDDTSMSLALMDGLAEMQQKDDYTKIMDKFAAWLNDGDYTVDGVFDVGRTCMDGILNYAKGISPTKCGNCGEFDNGNGALMRILPAVLFSLARYNEIDFDFISDISALTHGHYISKTSCKIYASVVQAILEKQQIKKILPTVVKKLDTQNLPAFNRLRNDSFFALSEKEIKSSGYVIDTLEAALWCLGNTTNYKDCVLTAVNFGNDTDTLAAVAGSLAGLFYGIETIPKKWIETLRSKEIIETIIDKFFTALEE